MSMLREYCVCSSITPVRLYISKRSYSDTLCPAVLLAKSPGRLTATLLVKERNKTDLSGPSTRKTARIQ